MSLFHFDGHVHEPDAPITGTGQTTAFKYALSYLTWPGLFAICMAITAYGFSHDMPVIFFNIAYLFLIISLFFLERWMPHEPLWHKNDGQIFADIAHTLSSKGTVQILLVFSGAIGLADFLDPDARSSGGIWPHDWPLWLQICLGIVAAEFGLYWAHRTAHELPVIWRIHAIHHSVRRLWIVNTGRFHFADSLFKIILGGGVLLAMGAPMEIIKWLSAVTAFIGMMTHCNVEMRFGWLNYIFNTPELHRWHHSKDLREGDKNYGENVLIWDLLFGTYFNEPRRPPLDIGIKEYMPQKFMLQLLWPFLTESMKKRMDSAHFTYVSAAPRKKFLGLF
jgi:sterol desaturase/sphingolipid hydroxylase (fatty acid hydroxylase superfamily)